MIPTMLIRFGQRNADRGYGVEPRSFGGILQGRYFEHAQGSAALWPRSPGILQVDEGRSISDQRAHTTSFVRHAVKIRKRNIAAAVPAAPESRSINCDASAYGRAGWCCTTRLGRFGSFSRSCLVSSA